MNLLATLVVFAAVLVLQTDSKIQSSKADCDKEYGFKASESKSL